MKPLGKTGKWVLEEWGVDTRNLSQRIIETFHLTNRPLSMKEICTADSIKGVYPEQSVRTYIDMGLGKDYLITDDGKYILASWQNSYEIDCDGVNRYDKQIWHDRLKLILDDKTLSTKEISDKYEELFAEPIGIINVSQRLKRSPCLQKTLVGGTNVWVWVKEYMPPIRITKTMIVSDAILKHLIRFPERSAKLSDIRDYICSKQDIPPASFYSIIDDDERFLKFKGENGSTFVKVYEYESDVDSVLNEGSQNLLKLLAIGENDKIEFKSSLQWDVKESRKNTELHNEVIKTVCAFANTNGGTLVIGVDDNSNILGLESDYNLFSKDNKRDAFHLTLSNIFDRSFDRDFCVGIDRKILQIEDNDICVIEVKPSPNPIFVKVISKQNAAPLSNVFFIRDNNRTLMINDNIELLQYVKRKWG